MLWCRLKLVPVWSVSKRGGLRFVFGHGWHSSKVSCVRHALGGPSILFFPWTHFHAATVGVSLSVPRPGTQLRDEGGAGIVRGRVWRRNGDGVRQIVELLFIWLPQPKGRGVLHEQFVLRYRPRALRMVSREHRVLRRKGIRCALRVLRCRARRDYHRALFEFAVIFSFSVFVFSKGKC